MDTGVNPDAATGYSLEQAERFGWSSLGSLNPERLEFLSRELPAEGSVLDLGCGPGGWSEWMASRGLRTFSMDMHRFFLERSALERRLVGSADRIPLRDGSVDCVLCMDVLEHVEDDLGALVEMRRVARDRILVTVPRRDDSLDRFNITFLHWQDRTHLRAYTEEHLSDLLRRAGFVDFRIEGELFVPWRELFASLARPSGPVRTAFMTALHFFIDLFRKPVPFALRRERIHASIGRNLVDGRTFSRMPTGLTAVIHLR